MAEPFSLAAAALGILDLVAKAFKLVRAYRRAPQQLIDIRDEAYDFSYVHAAQRAASLTASDGSAPAYVHFLDKAQAALQKPEMGLQNKEVAPNEVLKNNKWQRAWRRFRDRLRTPATLRVATLELRKIESARINTIACQTAEILKVMTQDTQGPKPMWSHDSMEKGLACKEAQPKDDQIMQSSKQPGRRFVRCSTHCLCICHGGKGAYVYVALPPYLRQVCGAMTVAHLNHSATGPHCNSCRFRSGAPVHFEVNYRFPKWVVQASMKLLITRSSYLPRFNLKMRRRVQPAQGDVFWSARHGDTDRLLQLMKENPMVKDDQRVDDGRVALHEAIYYSQMEIIFLLLRLGADYTIEDDRGSDAVKKLMLYMEERRLKPETSSILRRLLPESDYVDEMGLGPLHRAVLSHSGDDLESYLERLDPDTLHKQIRSVDALSRTPLHWAVQRDDVKAVELLIRWNAEVDARTPSGRTPLSLLVASQSAECFDVLVQNKADIYATEKSGWSIIHLAATWGSLPLVQKLTRHGSERVINSRTTKGYTPLIFAAYSNHFRIVKHLLERGAEVDAVNNQNLTALFFAVSENSYQSLSILLNYGADYQRLTESDETIWHRAARSADTRTLSKLVELKPSYADLTRPNKAGKTPLDLLGTHCYNRTVVWDKFQSLIAELDPLNGDHKEA